MVATVRCEEIANEKFAQFSADKVIEIAKVFMSYLISIRVLSVSKPFAGLV